jgi:hypothetical protein
LPACIAISTIGKLRVTARAGVTPISFAAIEAARDSKG